MMLCRPVTCPAPMRLLPSGRPALQAHVSPCSTVPSGTSRAGVTLMSSHSSRHFCSQTRPHAQNHDSSRKLETCQECSLCPGSAQLTLSGVETALGKSKTCLQRGSPYHFSTRHTKFSTRAVSGAFTPSTNNDDDNDDGGEEEGTGLAFPLLIYLPYLVSRRIRKYFRDNPWRRALFGGIALFLGFYVAQTVSLTLGALSLNDVVAAAFCVVFTEAVTKFYHTRDRPTFPQALLNVFKMGFTYGLMIDAFKLAS